MRLQKRVANVTPMTPPDLTSPQHRLTYMISRLWQIHINSANAAVGYTALR